MTVIQPEITRLPRKHENPTLYLGEKKKNQSTEMSLEPTQMLEIVDKDICKS